MKILPVSVIVTLLLTSCGVDGDPGHCYFSIDWEYYSDDYGVYYYRDNNPNVPESEDIISETYYECYPGEYSYYYEAEDTERLYKYTGVYTLFQNPGYSGGLFHDGLDGADTYFDLYLYVYARKDMSVISAIQDWNYEENFVFPLSGNTVFQSRELIPESVESRNSEVNEGPWTIRFEEKIEIFLK